MIAVPMTLAVLSIGLRLVPAIQPAVPEVTYRFTTPAAGGGGLVIGDNLPVVVGPLPAILTATSSTTLSPGLTLEQPSPLPVDTLGSAANGLACDGPSLVLDAQPQYACGPIAPLVVTNNGGTLLGWTLTGQISDFNDPAAPALTCDSTTTYNNHCIPGGDMGWIPQATLDIALSGTSAVVEPGPLIDASTTYLPGSNVSPPPGLNATPQVLCQAPDNLSQGQFTCGADVVLPVPASAAVPTSPGYEATLTLTLS